VIRLFPKVHDKFQVELKLEYLPGGLEAQYKVRSWLFVPQQLEVSPRTYSREDWYRDVRSYLRYKTPTAPLEDLADFSAPACKRLAEKVEAVFHGREPEAPALLRTEVRLFGCIVKAALRNAAHAWRKERRPKEALTLMRDGARVLKRYRDLVRPLGPAKAPAEALEACRIIDTFLSGLMEQHALEILEDAQEIAKGQKKKSEKGKKFRARVRNLARFVLALVTTEAQRRKRSDLLRSGPDGWDPGRLQRRSILKKFTESVLYLPVVMRQDGALKEQLWFALAAGVAMTFATLAVVWSNFNPGQITLPALFIVIISYMFKDRIKDWLRAWFATRQRRRGFDYVREARDSEGSPVARVHEKAWWVGSGGEVPEAVRQERGQDPDGRLEGSGLEERVLASVREVEVVGTRLALQKSGLPVLGITEILRFDIRSFTRGTADPSKRLWMLDADGRPRHRKVLRLYSLHWVLEFEGPEGMTRYAFRLGFNRKGLKHVMTLPDYVALSRA
jgi:hypothetical protein